MSKLIVYTRRDFPYLFDYNKTLIILSDHNCVSQNILNHKWTISWRFSCWFSFMPDVAWWGGGEEGAQLNKYFRGVEDMTH